MRATATQKGTALVLIIWLVLATAGPLFSRGAPLACAGAIHACCCKTSSSHHSGCCRTKHDGKNAASCRMSCDGGAAAAVLLPPPLLPPAHLAPRVTPAQPALACRRVVATTVSPRFGNSAEALSPL